jgi:hypothetical protein
MKVWLGADHGLCATVDNCITPQQQNNFDCGIFVAGFAKALTDQNCITFDENGSTVYHPSALAKYFEKKDGDKDFVSNLRGEMLKHVLKQTSKSVPVDQNKNHPVTRLPMSSTEPCPYASTKMFVDASTIPCLLLHHAVDILPGLPNTLACDFNMRTLVLTRLGVNCDEPEPNIVTNIVSRLRKERDGAPTCINGSFILVFTSYTDNNNNNNNNNSKKIIESMPMKSISGQECQIRESATPLTKEQLIVAIQWLHGKSSTAAVQQFNSIEDGLVIYLKTLKEKIPLQQPISTSPSTPKETMESVKQFILDHEWDFKGEVTTLVTDIEFELPDVDEDQSHYEALIYKVRRFLHRHIARQTGVIGHIVDGYHRSTGIVAVLNGFGENEQSYSQYNMELPHSSLEISATVFVPGDLEFRNKDAFTQTLKDISSKTQASVGCVHSLGKLPVFAKMITLLNKNCSNKGVKYYDSTMINVEYYDSTKMKPIVKEIKNTINSKEAEKFHVLVPEMKLESLKNLRLHEWMELFLRQGEGVVEKSYCFLCNTSNFIATHLISRYGEMYHFSRYRHVSSTSAAAWSSAISADAFELLVILFWSRLSSTTHEQLLNFFKSVNFATRQVSSADASGQLTNKWLTCMIITVFTSVHYSSEMFWRIMKAETIKKKEKSDHQKKHVLYMKQLIHAIKITTEFFSNIGTNPVHPQWYETIRHRITDPECVLHEFDNLIQSKRGLDIMNSVEVGIKKDSIEKKIRSGDFAVSDYVSFITIAFAVHIQRVTKEWIQDTAGRSFTFLEDDAQERLLTSTDPCGVSTHTTRINEFVNHIKDEEKLCCLVITHFLDTREFLPSKLAKKKKRTVIPHLTPSHQVYQAIEKVSKEIINQEVTSILNGVYKKSTSHASKARITQLLALRGKVNAAHFSSIYLQGKDA